MMHPSVLLLTSWCARRLELGGFEGRGWRQHRALARDDVTSGVLLKTVISIGGIWEIVSSVLYVSAAATECWRVP